VFQTWAFKMPKHKNVHFCLGIIHKYGFHIIVINTDSFSMYGIVVESWFKWYRLQPIQPWYVLKIWSTSQCISIFMGQKDHVAEKL